MSYPKQEIALKFLSRKNYKDKLLYSFLLKPGYALRRFIEILSLMQTPTKIKFSNNLIQFLQFSTKAGRQIVNVLTIPAEETRAYVYNHDKKNLFVLASVEEFKSALTPLTKKDEVKCYAYKDDPTTLYIQIIKPQNRSENDENVTDFETTIFEDDNSFDIVESLEKESFVTPPCVSITGKDFLDMCKKMSDAKVASAKIIGYNHGIHGKITYDSIGQCKRFTYGDVIPSNKCQNKKPERITKEELVMLEELYISKGIEITVSKEVFKNLSTKGKCICPLTSNVHIYMYDNETHDTLKFGINFASIAYFDMYMRFPKSEK